MGDASSTRQRGSGQAPRAPRVPSPTHVPGLELRQTGSAPNPTQWTVLRELGRGAGSVVQLALRTVGGGDLRTEHEYALKRVRSDSLGPRQLAEAERRLCREAALLASVNHPGLTRVHAVDRVDGRLAIVMDAHDGTSLGDLLHAPGTSTTPRSGADRTPPGRATRGRLTTATTVRFALDVCDALDALHRSGLVHRDVKPANVLVVPHGRAVLVDLGVAHLSTALDRTLEVPDPEHAPRGDGEPGPERRRPPSRTAEDGSDAELGAMLYRSPEQAGVVRAPVDHRADLYSLGAIVLECLTGHPPVQGTDPAEVRRQLGRLQPLEPTSLPADVPPALAALLRRLLAIDPQDRPASAAAVADDLARIGAGMSPDVAQGRRSWTSPADGALLERAAQLTLLDSAWEAARGGTGSVVVVRGAAGSGRTALVDQVRRRAQGQGAATVVLDTTTSPNSPLTALRRAVVAAGLDVGPQRPGPDRPEALGDDLLQHARRAGPLLVVVDDVEHADASTLAVLRWLALECADLPVLLVLVDHPGRDGGRVGLDVGRTLVVDVPALSDSAARAVVRRRLPGAVVTDGVATALVSRAAGNPGALLALLGALLDDGGLLPDWGQWRLEEAALEAVPVAPGLLAALLRRVDELPAAHRNVLRLAAACGRSVDDDLVLRAAGPHLSPDEVRAGLAAGVAARLLRPAAVGRHEFLHQQVVDAVLAGIDPVDRTGLHARLARVLRHDTLSDTRAVTDGAGRDAVFASAHQHLLAGDAVPAADVVAACGLAGVEAARRYATDVAVDLLERAARVADDGSLPLDPRLRRLLASCLARGGHHARAHQHLSRLLGAAADPVERAVVLGEIATLHRHGRAADGPALAARAAADGLTELGTPRPGAAPGWARFALASVLLLVAAMLSPARRRPSRHRLDSPREAEKATLEAARAVLLREAADADLAAGRPLPALPTAVAGATHAVLARRSDLADDCRRTLGAGVRLFLRGRRTLLPVRLPGTSGLVGRPLTPPAQVSGEDPGLLASVRLADGLRRLGSGGTWRDVADVLEEQGQWLDLPAYTAGVDAVVVERIAAGHLTAARAWYDRALRRVPEGAAPPVQLRRLEVVLLVAAGRPGDAGAALESLRDSLSPDAARDHQLALAVTELQWLVEQSDTSDRFDAACRRVDRLLRRTGGPAHRVGGDIALWGALLVTRGRLAQHRAAADAGDVVRLRTRDGQLRVALRRVSRISFGGRGSALQLVVRSLLRTQALARSGRRRTATRALARTETAAAPLDAPLLTHATLTLRAELLEASGAVADADRQRWLATALAEKHDWANVLQRNRSPQSGPTSGTPRGTWATTSGRRRRLLSAMRDVGNAAQVLDPQDLVRLALDQACEVLGADRAVLALLDADDDLVPFAGRSRTGTDLPASMPLDPAVRRSARTGRPVVRGWLDADALGDDSTGGARSVVAVPLLVRGRRTGVLSAASTVAQGAFGRGDVELLQLIAGQVAASLETARAARLEIEVHGAQRERDLAEAVRRVTEEVSGSLDLATVRRRLLVAAVGELGARRGALVPVAVRSALDADPPALVVSAGNRVREVAWDRDWQSEPETAALLERATSASGSAALPDRLLRVLGADPADDGEDDGALPAHWLVVPLKDRTGLVAESLVLLGEADGPAAQAHVADALAAPSAIGLENARLFAQVEHLARTDSLTGLATRGHLIRLGEQRVRRAALGRSVAALMVDVDHFKAVNDRYGHAAGDEVLTAVARRLQHEARETDVLGRYGGEEFALVITSPGDDELDVREVAERLRVGVNRTPVEVRGEQLTVTVSVGVAELREGEQLSDVLARADTALYRAKAAGRDVVVVAP